MFAKTMEPVVRGALMSAFVLGGEARCLGPASRLRPAWPTSSPTP
jgi:hypothetical protein